MVFREIIAIQYKNHVKHINTQCEQNAEILFIKACLAYVETSLP